MLYELISKLSKAPADGLPLNTLAGPADIVECRVLISIAPIRFITRCSIRSGYVRS